MLRRLGFLLIPLVLVAAACSNDNGDDNGADGDVDAPTATAYAIPNDTSGDGDDAEPTTVIGDTDTDPDGGGSGALLSTLNPLDLLSAAGAGQPGFGDADPSLQAALLTQEDLPGDFMSSGDFTYNVPSEYGELRLAASMFASGDLDGGEFGAMVMSAAVAVPPEALDELGDPSDWASASSADLEELRATVEESGLGLSELSLLDASGLGEGGLGMRMTMDLGALFGAFGAPEEDNPFAEGISIDMYIFLRGETMLMTVVMWPAAAGAGVDAYALAQVMDGRAISAPASN